MLRNKNVFASSFLGRRKKLISNFVSANIKTSIQIFCQEIFCFLVQDVVPPNNRYFANCLQVQLLRNYLITDSLISQSENLIEVIGVSARKIILYFLLFFASVYYVLFFLKCVIDEKNIRDWNQRLNKLKFSRTIP